MADRAAAGRKYLFISKVTPAEVRRCDVCCLWLFVWLVAAVRADNLSRLCSRLRLRPR
jgi:hypothetical protein